MQHAFRILILSTFFFAVSQHLALAQDAAQTALEALDKALKDPTDSEGSQLPPETPPPSPVKPKQPKGETPLIAPNVNEKDKYLKDLEQNTDRYGNDLSCMHPVPDVETCKVLCLGNIDCLAFTWVRPGYISKAPFDGNPICCLKKSLGQPTANNCCTSGVK